MLGSIFKNSSAQDKAAQLDAQFKSLGQQQPVLLKHAALWRTAEEVPTEIGGAIRARFKKSGKLSLVGEKILALDERSKAGPEKQQECAASVLDVDQRIQAQLKKISQK